MRKILILSTAVFFSSGLYAQKDAMYPKYIDFGKDNAPSYQKGNLFASNSTRVSSTTEVKLLSENTDEQGFTHYRFHQLLNGIPVEGTSVIQHVKNGKLMYQNGDLVKNFPESARNNTRPRISENDALNFAKKYIGAKVYKWEIEGEEDFIKRESGNPNATFLPKAEKVYYSPGSEFNAKNLRLAYKFDIYSHAPLSRKIVYVDAVDGKILGYEDKIKEIFHGEYERHDVNKLSGALLANAAGTATTAYSGAQSITTDYTGSTYRLRETGRGNGIETYNLQRGTSYTSAVDFTDADNNWNNVNAAEDQYATDAHWGAEKVYDFYQSKYNRNSIDNAGMKILSYVHYSSNYLNAFWDGSRMTYGDGDSTTTPLTSLDIVGHEITHGVTERTSNLAYRAESGALNEAYSDILGMAVEWTARPATANWLMGEQIGMTFRSMSNPNAYNQPDTYKGTQWVNTVGCTPSSANDQCGVHTNSGVLNFWFYLLVNGGTGTNDISSAYNVSGIGIEKAAAIAYRTNTNYLGASSTYADARTYSIKSAEDLYGVGSNEVNQVMNAFHAVGIGAAAGGTTPPPTGCSVAFEANETLATAAAISLNVDNSAAIGSSTDVDYYKFTTTSTGNITVALTGPSGVDYDMYVYNSAGTELGKGETSTASETVSLTNQAAGTYYAKIIGYNGATSATCYTIKATGTTSTATCNAPTGLTSGLITQASATVSWAAVSGATGYSLEYKTSAGTTYTVQSVTGTSATLSGLTAGTLYDWRVKTTCSATSSSAYASAQFTTTSTTTSCNNAYEPNNTTSAATTITALNTDYKAAVETTTDSDYYKITFTTGGNFTVKLTGLTHDVDLKLYSASGTQLKSSTNSGTTAEKIQYNGTATTYYIRVYPYSGSSPNTCYTLRVEPGLTITGFAAPNNDIINEEYKVYPSPVNDVLNITSPEKFVKNSVIEVYDLAGNLRMTRKVSSSNEKINVNNLPKGVYVMKVDNGDGEPMVSKFIKK